MTSKRISDQIDTIRVATEKASVSSEAALAFLRNAGIISEANQVAGTGGKRGATGKLEMPAYQRPNGGVASSKNIAVQSSQSGAIRYSAAKKSK